MTESNGDFKARDQCRICLGLIWAKSDQEAEVSLLAHYKQGHNLKFDEKKEIVG